MKRLSDLDKKRTVHMAGIGGSAMCGLALILKQKKLKIFGTDQSPDSIVMEKLLHSGIEVSTKQDGSQIKNDTQLVITTAALSPNHPELKSARDLGIPVIKYAEMLGILMNDSNSIAVAGTHGKTTSTGMLIAGIKNTGLDPGYIVGGFVPQFGASADGGNCNIFVAEACEYDRSFLNLVPKRAIITNVEEDHLDIYKDIDDICAAFGEFVNKIPKDGTVFYNWECPNTRRVVKNINCKKVSFGFDKNADYSAKNIHESDGFTVFDVMRYGEKVATVSLMIPGRHNISNALSVFALALDMGLSSHKIVKGLEKFRGVSRRFDIHGTVNDIVVVDDYAHHPTEIRALIEGAKARFAKNRIVIGFQPHQVSRTKLLFHDFVKAFDGIDELWLTDIYAARDEKSDGNNTSCAHLASAIRTRGIKVNHLPTVPKLCEYAIENLLPGDVFITVGAGDVYQVASKVLNSLEKKQK